MTQRREEWLLVSDWSLHPGSHVDKGAIMKLVGVYELFTIPGEQYTLTSRSRDFDVSDKFFVPHEADIILTHRE